MSPTNRHFHVALGEQGTWNFRLLKFDESCKAIDFFLNMSAETFKTLKKSSRATLEYRMYEPLENTEVMLFDGSDKYMSLIFGCNSKECMISTYN